MRSYCWLSPWASFAQGGTREVLAPVGDALVLALECDHRLPAVRAAFGAASNAPLHHALLLLLAAVPVLGRHGIAVADHDQTPDAHVDADLAAGCRQRHRRGLDAEGGVPVAGRAREPERLERALKWPVPAHRDPSNARHFHAPPVQPKAVAQVL